MEDLQDRARTALRGFRTFIEKYRGLRAKMSLSEWTRALVDDIGILRQLKEERTIESLGRWENVQELLSAISEFAQEHPDATLEAFLENVALVSDIDSWEGTKNAVTLMTLHASKGLEFPVVFISGLEEGLLPFYAGPVDASELEEERRLCYVGVTRAREKLYLTYTTMRYRFGDVTYPSESRFLSELGTEYIERVLSRSVDRVTDVMAAQRSLRPTSRRNVASITTPKTKPQEFYPDQLPDYETESQEAFELKHGVIVLHETFGRGRVLSVSGKGDSQKAQVDFENYGMKSLIVKFAKLRKES
jgi:DNA helicase-2/ATP-dependent DNA helicase PcrA